MAQRFLLTAVARSLSLKQVFKMGEDAAYQAFCKMHWTATDSEAVCQRLARRDGHTRRDGCAGIA